MKICDDCKYWENQGELLDDYGDCTNPQFKKVLESIDYSGDYLTYLNDSCRFFEVKDGTS